MVIFLCFQIPSVRGILNLHSDSELSAGMGVGQEELPYLIPGEALCAAWRTPVGQSSSALEPGLSPGGRSDLDQSVSVVSQSHRRPQCSVLQWELPMQSAFPVPASAPGDLLASHTCAQLSRPASSCRVFCEAVFAGDRTRLRGVEKAAQSLRERGQGMHQAGAA